MDKSPNYLVVVVGPTAVGKTDLCIDLAKYFNTEIVNADSRQFYKELQIGTAKPTTEEMKGIKHHFINSLSVTEDYNVGSYEIDALKCLEELFKHKNIIILTGGSGLFIKAVCEGLDEMPEIKDGVRQILIEQFEKEGISLLQEELKITDPDYYKNVDLANHARVIRALEVIRSTNKPFSSFRNKKTKKRPFNIIKIGLTRDRQELYDRINLRMDLMIKEGLVEEVKSVLKYKDYNALRTVGYKEIFDFWDDKYDWEETVRLLKQNSRRYAKRQMTWFNKDKAINWFHPKDISEIIKLVEKIIKTN